VKAADREISVENGFECAIPLWRFRRLPDTTECRSTASAGLTGISGEVAVRVVLAGCSSSHLPRRCPTQYRAGNPRCGLPARLVPWSWTTVRFQSWKKLQSPNSKRLALRCSNGFKRPKSPFLRRALENQLPRCAPLASTSLRSLDRSLGRHWTHRRRYRFSGNG
jgi:hypothetical protein